MCFSEGTHRSDFLREALSDVAIAPQMTAKRTNLSRQSGSCSMSPSGSSYTPSTGMNCVQKVCSTLSVAWTRQFSTVGTYLPYVVMTRE